jgi:hypothetical protein
MSNNDKIVLELDRKEAEELLSFLEISADTSDFHAEYIELGKIIYKIIENLKEKIK